MRRITLVSLHTAEEMISLLNKFSDTIVDESRNYEHFALKRLKSDLSFVGKKVRVKIFDQFDIECFKEGLLEEVWTNCNYLTRAWANQAWSRWCTIIDNDGYKWTRELIGEIQAI